MRRADSQQGFPDGESGTAVREPDLHNGLDLLGDQ
jgi:hypothetical protein